MIEPSLLEILACPKCHSPLREQAVSDSGEAAVSLACTNPECALVYPVRDGIPVLLIDEATKAA